MKFELKDICFFDCETTGVPAKGLKWDADFNQFPHVVQLAWAFGDKERSFIIKPDNYEIPPETTAIHGITTERAIAEGVPFAEVIDEFLTDAAAAPLVCAHIHLFRYVDVESEHFALLRQRVLRRQSRGRIAQGKAH